MIDVLLVAYDEQAVDGALGPFAVELDLDVVASELRAEAERDG